MWGVTSAFRGFGFGVQGLGSVATLEFPLSRGDCHCEPSALYCWILEILCCNPKGRRASGILSKALRPVYGRAKCLPMLGTFTT